MTTASASSRSRKQKIVRWNRMSAWIVLPFMVIGQILYMIPSTQTIGSYMQIIWLLFWFIHAVLSFYLYALPKPKANLRVFHIYLGYATFVFTMISQSLFGMDDIKRIFDILMWASIAVHVALAVYYYNQRKQKADAMQAYYEAKGFVRDV